MNIQNNPDAPVTEDPAGAEGTDAHGASVLVDRPAGTISATEASAPGAAPNRKGIGKMRWAIAILLFFGVLINYIDRSSIAVAEGHIRDDFGLSAAEMALRGK